MKTRKELVSEWRECAIDYAIMVAQSRDDNTVSVNDLVEGMRTGHNGIKLLPPPGNPTGKRGNALIRIFAAVPMFRDTGRRVPSIMPSSHKRRVVVWEYAPENDERGIEMCSESPWDKQLGWS